MRHSCSAATRPVDYRRLPQPQGSDTADTKLCARRRTWGKESVNAADSEGMRRRRRAIFRLFVGVLALAATATAGGGAASSWGNRPPVNTTPPSIGGAAIVGDTFTGDPGRWTGPKAKYSFQ